MLGPKQEAQGALFYEFSIDNHVPQDHLLRSIDRFVDLSSIRPHLAEFYSHTGRPSIDPELLVRMLVVGYCLGIRSERRLCEEVHLNLAYRWFCRLDLSDPVPNHSTWCITAQSLSIALCGALSVMQALRCECQHRRNSRCSKMPLSRQGQIQPH